MALVMDLGIYSMVYASIAFALIMCALNHWAIRRTIGYHQEIKKTFVINPKGTALVSLTPASRKITVKWKKQAVQTTGYQIQYSTDKTFKKGVKSVTKKGTSTVSAVVSGLTSKKTYYVRIRTYKTVSGKTYYSAWSTVKKTIVK
jgi:hypothetical protein